MTIDIIAAAQADRKAKLDQILALQLDVIEIDAFIAKARAYAGEGETDTTAPTPLPEDQGYSAAASIAQEHRPAEAKTVDQEPSSDGSGGVQDGLPVHPAKLFTAPIREDRIERDREVIERRRRLGLV